MITAPEIIDLPKISDPRGNLTFIEALNHIPFEIKRVYWIYDVPGGETRGGHAFQNQEEFIIALSGSFDVIINDGFGIIKFSLNRSYFGLRMNTYCLIIDLDDNNKALSTYHYENFNYKIFYPQNSLFNFDVILVDPEIESEFQKDYSSRINGYSREYIDEYYPFKFIKSPSFILYFAKNAIDK